MQAPAPAPAPAPEPADLPVLEELNPANETVASPEDLSPTSPAPMVAGNTINVPGVIMVVPGLVGEELGPVNGTASGTSGEVSPTTPAPMVEEDSVNVPGQVIASTPAPNSDMTGPSGGNVVETGVVVDMTESAPAPVTGGAVTASNTTAGTILANAPTEGQVSPNACLGGSWYWALEGNEEVRCFKTSDCTNPAHCCLSNFCMCGRPELDLIEANCVPPYDMAQLQAAQTVDVGRNGGK